MKTSRRAFLVGIGAAAIAPALPAVAVEQPIYGSIQRMLAELPVAMAWNDLAAFGLGCVHISTDGVATHVPAKSLMFTHIP